ncbi:transglutaminase-like cysteine peptidase [Phenylobacterium ferrooxidans]|uniref:Transglutaminase-like cysteine peptidase n=1 Tax=Phenylobacterium ferrooxidans TaxID=2982689 RepID=A0ABW6CJD6_9CAUL
MSRPLDKRIIWVLALMFCGGVWTGLALAVRSWSADLLTSVNRSANVVDRRTQPLEVGGDTDGVFDCEDYALLKRRLLIEAGVSPADLHLWAVTTSRGARHMVLEAKGVILDNLTPWAIPRKDVTYYSGWTAR